MFGSLNKVTIVGNVGKDPTTVQLNSTTNICKFPVATTEVWKDRNTGERKEKTDWHNVSIMTPGLAKICEDFVRKGTKICIDGSIRYSQWQDNSGNTRYGVEIVVGSKGSVSILSSTNQQPQGSAAPRSQSTQDSTNNQDYSSYLESAKQEFDDEDSIPFD